MSRDVKLCRHCNCRKVNRPRGLCWHCYYTPGVRALYPSTNKYAPHAARGITEPTEAELEAMIAEQMACLPDWWHKEAAREHRGACEPAVKKRKVLRKRGAA